MLNIKEFIVTISVTVLLYGRALGQENGCKESCKCQENIIQCNTIDFTLVLKDSTLNIVCRNNMSENGLSAVNQFLSNRSDILDLTLDSCIMPAKPLRETIDHLDQLKILVIIGNNTDTNSVATTLQNLAQIQNLTLTNLGLKKGDVSFEGMKSLTFLNLTRNNFSEIPGIQEGHQNLSSIDLSYNNITTFTVVKSMCAALPGLRNLNLSGNRGIKERIRNDTFTSCSGLIELHLADLGLEKFDYNTWSLETLSVIDMSYNNFTNLSTDDLLIPWNNMTDRNISIYLANSKIKNITAGNKNFSTNFKTVKVLDLSYNDLANVDNKTLDVLNKTGFISKFKLAGNPWRCDCDFVNMTNFVKENEKKIMDFDNLKCSEKGWSVKDLTECDLCYSKWRFLWIVLAIVIVVGVAGGFIYTRSSGCKPITQ